MSNPVGIKIDDWNNFVMQRLCQLFKKGELCDYSICSTALESFKVHRVVLNACSDYFFSHPSTDTSITGILIPKHLDFNAVKSIIMFMYTGQLHYTEENRINLLEVAKMFKVTALVEQLELLSHVKKPTTKPHLPLTLTPRIHSALALKKYNPPKKLYHKKSTVRSPPKRMPMSTFINTMKAKDVLSENKPMRFECIAEDLPEFIENPFEKLKNDSAPIIKQDNINSTETTLKRTSDEAFIDKHNKTLLVKCDTLKPSPTGFMKLKIVSDAVIENTNNEVVQEISKKFPHLLQSKGNIKVRILSRNNDQNQFENIIINTNDSVEKTLSVSSDIEEPLAMHEVKPDIMNIKGPCSCNLLEEKHNQKEDAKVCEHCGLTISKKSSDTSLVHKT